MGKSKAAHFHAHQFSQLAQLNLSKFHEFDYENWQKKC